jgi:hypothetical protein
VFVDLDTRAHGSASVAFLNSAWVLYGIWRSSKRYG